MVSECCGWGNAASEGAECWGKKESLNMLARTKTHPSSPVLQALALFTVIVSNTVLSTWKHTALQNTRQNAISHNQLSTPLQHPCKYLLRVGCWKTKKTVISDLLSLWKESSCEKRGSQSSEIWGLGLMHFRHWSYIHVPLS